MDLATMSLDYKLRSSTMDSPSTSKDPHGDLDFEMKRVTSLVHVEDANSEVSREIQYRLYRRRFAGLTGLVCFPYYRCIANDPGVPGCLKCRDCYVVAMVRPHLER